MTQSSKQTQAPSQLKTDPQLLTLTSLLSLHERVRPVALQELKFISVNELKNVIDYTHAMLVKVDEGAFQIESLSGVAEVDKNIPYTLFIKSLLNSFKKQGMLEQTKTSTFSKTDIKNNTVQKEWQEWLPSQGLIIPLFTSGYRLILARKSKWSERDMAIAAKVQTLFDEEFIQKARAENPLTQQSLLRGIRRSKGLLILLCFGVLLFPFRTSVLIPAEIVPLNPALVRAPLEGVIEKISVSPNQRVFEGDLLFSYDQRLLHTQIERSQNALKVAQAELRQTSQEALSDPRARLKVSQLQGEVKKEKYSLEYAKELLASTDVLAPRAGIVVFEDVFDWVGRPVSIGEKVMVLAKGDQTELELRLPVYDNIGITINADVRFFSNANPDQPIKATIRHHSYRASTSDLGDVSYRLKAKWENTGHKSTPRIGLKGSAKVYGERKPFVLHILRRPLVEVRQWLGM